MHPTETEIMFFCKDKDQSVNDESYREKMRREQLKQDIEAIEEDRRRSRANEDEDQSMGGFGEY